MNLVIPLPIQFFCLSRSRCRSGRSGNFVFNVEVHLKSIKSSSITKCLISAKGLLLDKWYYWRQVLSDVWQKCFCFIIFCTDRSARLIIINWTIVRLFPFICYVKSGCKKLVLKACSHRATTNATANESCGQRVVDNFAVCDGDSRSFIVQMSQSGLQFWIWRFHVQLRKRFWVIWYPVIIFSNACHNILMYAFTIFWWHVRNLSLCSLAKISN